VKAARVDSVLSSAVTLLVAASLACTGATPEPATEPPYAAYVLLVEAPDHTPVPFARVIVASGQPCPTLTGGARPIVTTRRDNPHGFTVDLCEAVVPFEQPLTVAGSSSTLPAVHREVSRVVVVGDTGCKPDEQTGCGLDDPQWPFQTLAQAAAAGEPDLVLHMGDYNYRGTPSHFDRVVDGTTTKVYYYDAGDGAPEGELCGLNATYYSQNVPAGAEGSDPDSWEPWWLDFFQPAADLLAAAPWVFARGNHELCSHAGPGWLYFLGPGSNLAEGGGVQAACPPQESAGSTESHLVFVEPQVVALDGLTVAVLDSANACDELDNFAERYGRQFASVAARLDGETAWLMGHRPVWGVVGETTEAPYRCDNQPGTGPAQPYAAMNRTLQCALAGDGGAPGAALLPALDLVLAGHMHRFEWLGFADGSGRPPQLVVGNSGVSEDAGPPTGSFSQTVDGQPASGFSVEEFGFVRLERGAGDAWSGAVVTTDPAAWSAYLPACGTPPAAGAFLCVEGLPR